MTDGENPEAIEARLRAAMPEKIEGRVQSARLANGRAIIVAEAVRRDPACATGYAQLAWSPRLATCALRNAKCLKSRTNRR